MVAKIIPNDAVVYVRVAHFNGATTNIYIVRIDCVAVVGIGMRVIEVRVACHVECWSAVQIIAANVLSKWKRVGVIICRTLRTVVAIVARSLEEWTVVSTAEVIIRRVPFVVVVAVIVCRAKVVARGIGVPRQRSFRIHSVL